LQVVPKMRMTAVVVTMTLFAVVLGASSAFAAKIVVEAEKYATIAASMQKIGDNTAGGKAALQIPLRRPHAATETGPGDTGNATFKINVAQAGTYQFWARCWWYDACGNSFFVMADATAVTARTPYLTDQTFKKWHWVAGPTFTLSAGQHTIRIQNREDGARVDQWLLTTTPRNRWEPTRIEVANQ
jgi:hypothetical protein